MLSVGIVGLPNVGKSTLFNALTRAGAEVSNYPFTTIDSNVGVVPVPDERLDTLAALLEPDSVTPASIEFVDIAGLVEGASRGEGLGNQFLGEIRAVDAIAHVVRQFPDPDVAHVAGDVDPVRDAAVVESELLAADRHLLAGIIHRRRKEWATHPGEHADERERLERYRQLLDAGTPLRELDPGAAERRELKGLGLLTGKPLLYVVNVDEESDSQTAADRIGSRLAASDPTGSVHTVAISVRLEAELMELEPSERQELMAGLELDTTGLERLAAAAFDLLDLVRFYTVVSGKLRAWQVPRGTPAPAAAGTIHSDMESGFVRAKVVAIADLVDHGSVAAAAAAGRVRTEGRDYEMEDGDVVEFMFTE